jgi:ribonuclease Z
MQFDLTILGSNGAIPAHDRHPSSQILNYNGSLFLIDCGEGTQFRLNKFNIKRGRLDHIFISHLHGDHYFGLVGLLTSFNLNWRETPLHIYGPAGIEEIMNVHFKHSQTQLKFQIHYHHLLADEPRVIYEDEVLQVETIILKHRLPTTGFYFKEKKGLRKILADKIVEYKIPYTDIVAIKKGADFTDEHGSIVPNIELTTDPPEPRSYAYCSDTVYIDSFTVQIKGVGLLYHEATFVDEHTARALETYHTTSRQAAEVAKKAKAGKLVIGHFSARYENLEILLSQAREVFPETYLATEGTVFPI